MEVYHFVNCPSSVSISITVHDKQYKWGHPNQVCSFNHILQQPITSNLPTNLKSYLTLPTVHQITKSLTSSISYQLLPLFPKRLPKHPHVEPPIRRRRGGPAPWQGSPLRCITEEAFAAAFLGGDLLLRFEEKPTRFRQKLWKQFRTICFWIKSIESIGFKYFCCLCEKCLIFPIFRVVHPTISSLKRKGLCVPSASSCLIFLLWLFAVGALNFVSPTFVNARKQEYVKYLAR